MRTIDAGVILRPLALAAIPLMVGLAACGGDDLVLPKDGEPARIAAVGGTDLRETVGRVLSDSLVVEVTDPGGRPVSGVEVLFVPPAGAAVAPADRIITGSDGRASVSYTLSTTAGEQIVEARAPIEPATNAVASIRVLADPETPEGLIEDGGNQQSAQVSTVLPESLAVKAVDRFGNGVAGIEVTWQASGGGIVSPTTVMTGTDGRAATARTLGDRPGSYGALARAEISEEITVPFIATAVPAPRPGLALVIQPSNVAAAGVRLEQQPELQLNDPFGFPVSQEGVRVTVQIDDGDGSVGGRTEVTSDANGRVTFTDLELRGETGTKTLIFAAEGFNAVSSTEIVVRPGPPAASQTSVSIPNGVAGERTSISVRLRDEFGNEISGAAADVSVRISGANPSTGLPVSENDNGTYTSSYVPVHSGRDEVTIVFRGEPLGGGASTSIVAPGPADPSTTTAVVTKTGVLFVQVDVVVTTRDAQGNPLDHGGDRVEIIPNGGPPRVCAPLDEATTCVDRGNGTYADRFIIVAASVSVAIRLNGVPLAGSPYTP